jgi:putative two-component system response regulator
MNLPRARKGSAGADTRPLVLVVEPNPLMAEMVRAILRSFEVRLVPPDELVDIAGVSHPAIIILEILLRGQDGLQLCRALKSRPATRRTPVLVFSVLDAAEEAVAAGADAFLLKPAERRVLAEEVRRLTQGCGKTPRAGSFGGGWL